jgi:hypothetical protein
MNDVELEAGSQQFVPTAQPSVHTARRLRASSELLLERKLDRARSANLVERVETDVGAARPQAARQRLPRVAEQGAGQVVVGVSEFG